MSERAVSAIIVTRGDVSLEEPAAAIRESGVVDELLVWGNDSAVGPNVGRLWTRDLRPGDTLLSAGPGPGIGDVAVYGRYAAIEYARGDLIYVQDDDAVVEPAAIRELVVASAAIAPHWIVANMPESRWPDYPDSCLVGWGAVFPRDLPERAFSRFALSSHRNGAIAWGANGVDRSLFDRTCDVVFTTLTPHRKVDLGFRHLPWAETAGRMFKQPHHKKERDEMLELARMVRDGR